MIAGTCDRDEGSEADRGETGTVASPGDPRAASDGEPAYDRGRQRHRSTSAVVALVAVAVLAVATIVAVRSVRARSDDPASVAATTEWYPLRVTLEVSTTTPSPTETVRATLTVTNISADPFELPRPCARDMALVPTADGPGRGPGDPAGDPGAASSPIGHLRRALGPFITGAVLQAPDPGDTCPGGTIELQPGVSTTVTGVRAMGSLGLDPVDVALVALARPYEQTRVAAAFTVPPPPEGTRTRRAALDLVLAQPAVEAFARAAVGDAAAPAPPTSTGFAPLGDGWEIRYEAGEHRLVVQVHADGTGTVTADGVTSPLDPTAAG